MGTNIKCHNPYFNRWFSAISMIKHKSIYNHRHNPYFNRWFSAIGTLTDNPKGVYESQSLF